MTYTWRNYIDFDDAGYELEVEYNEDAKEWALLSADRFNDKGDPITLSDTEAQAFWNNHKEKIIEHVWDCWCAEREKLDETR